MLLPAFQYNVNHNIIPGLVDIGHYDSESDRPSLTCGTTGGKVFLHTGSGGGSASGNGNITASNSGASPAHDTSPAIPSSRPNFGGHGSASGGDLRFLNINQEITALASGRLDPSSSSDMLLIGTRASLQAYDVEGNTDIFFKDVPDGVNVIQVGYLSDIQKPLAFAGGNCTVQGFDKAGNEVYWTVTGDNVGALELADVNWDEKNELLVGSDDYNIRIFANDEVVGETAENDAVTHLCSVHDISFGYSLADGTVGMISGTNRPWRRKTKHKVVALHSFDLDADGVPELIVGWDNGRFEVRSDTTGDVIYKDMFPASVSGIVDADYLQDGNEEVVCASFNGEIRGYLPVEGDSALGNVNDESNQENQAVLSELLQRKAELESELRTYEDNMKRFKDQKQGKKGAKADVVEGVIPVTTELDVDIGYETEDGTPTLRLFLETNNNDALVHGVLLIGEQVFKGESLFQKFNPPSNNVSVVLPVRPFAEGTIKVLAMVGLRAAKHFHIFESDQSVSKFAVFMSTDMETITKSKYSIPSDGVTLRISERVRRIDMWMRQVFIVGPGLPQDQNMYGMDEWFLNVSDQKSIVRILIESKDPQTIRILTDSLATASELVQDLCSYLKINELNSTAYFPQIETELGELLQKVEDYNAVRMRMTADMADLSNLIKALVVQAEDARMLDNMDLMRKAYASLRDTNRDLVMEHSKRASNQQELLECLKEINQIIQRASQCRIGDASRKIVAMCRQAIKSVSVDELIRVIRLGTQK